MTEQGTVCLLRYQQRCWYHESPAPLVSRYCADRGNCCWSISELFTFTKSTSERQNLFYTSVSLNLPGTPRREHEAVLTDWRADEHCNIVLHRQHSQFLQQTLIWSKVVLLAIYFSWSHWKRVLISVLNLTSTCCPEENQGQINDFQRQDSFFSSRFRKWFCLDE